MNSNSRDSEAKLGTWTMEMKTTLNQIHSIGMILVSTGNPGDRLTDEGGPAQESCQVGLLMKGVMVLAGHSIDPLTEGPF